MPDRALYFSPRARADLKTFPREAQIQILEDLESLAASTALPPPPRVKKLKGPGHYHRLRTGNFRLIFRLEGGAIRIARVVSRRDLERILARLWA